MFNLLAASRFLNYFRAYYEVLGGLGLFAGFIFFTVLVTCSFSRKGVYFLFFLFLIASMLSATDPEEVARTAAISVFRYMLLFPVALWGLISLVFYEKKVGPIGWLLLVYCLLHIPGWMTSPLQGGGARLIGMFLVWLAIVGFLSPDVNTIEKLKQLLQRMGWVCWVLVGIAVLYILISPYESFLGGRLRSIWHRPNAFGISMFFVVVVLAYRIFLMDFNYLKTLDVICLFAAMIMLVMSGTRAAGFGTAIVLLPFMRGKSFKYYLLTFFVFIVFLGVVIAVPDLQRMAVERFIPTSEMDTAGRALMWQYQWQTALSRPVFGYGLGDADDWNPAGSHNSFIAIALVSGFLNMALFVLISLTALFSSLNQARFQYYATDRKLCHHITFSVIGILFICFFESLAIGIGGAGITIIWLIFYCVNGLSPAPLDQADYWVANEQDVYYEAQPEGQCPIY